MRKYLSVMGLWVRGAFWGAVGIIAAMAAAELAVLRYRLSEAAGNLTTFSAFASAAGIRAVFLPALGLLIVRLVTAVRSGRNTLGRLSVSMTVSALLYSLCSLLWLVIFWAAQIAVLLTAYRWFHGAVDPAMVSGQSLMISFYSSEEMHWLIPLADIRLWIAVISLGLSLSLCIGVDALMLWNGGGFPMSTVAMGTAAVIFYGTGADLAVITVSVVLSAVQILRLVQGVRGEEYG